MKNILLLIHDDEGQEARLQTALTLARGLGGHIRCLDVSILPNIAGDFYGASGLILEDERRREAANKLVIEDRLRREDVAWDWTDIIGEIAPCLAREAALADLIVVNRGLETILATEAQQAAGRLLRDARTPVWAAAQTGTTLSLGGSALIAWDGSDVAAAALRAATPLLKLSQAVTLLQIGEPDGGVAVEDAAAYLSRHGVHGEIAVVPGDGRDVGAQLIAESTGRGADYIVMGAYGHNRLRETLFGGVSRTLLSRSALPLFLAH